MECDKDFIDNREYIRQFNAKAAELRIPVSGSIDLTHRCNLRCLHCYLRGQSALPSRQEMNTGTIVSLLDDIAEAGCLYLLFTGGEPLLREDFADIYSHAKKNGLIVTVFTNGTVISKKIIDLFCDLPPQVVEISLYGATARTYEQITGVEGSFERCMRGIENLLKHNIRVGLKTILMSINNHEFFEIENIAKGFGAKFRFDAAIFPCLDGDKFPLSLRVPPADAVFKEFSDGNRLRVWEEYFERSVEQEPSEKLYNCGAGVTGFHIDPYGSLQPCIMTTRIKYNLTKGSFLEGWNGSAAGLLAKKAGELRCARCEKRHLCGFCPAFFEMENGAEDACSEYLCSMGNQRYRFLRNVQLERIQHGV